MKLYHGTLTIHTLDILKNGIDLSKGTNLCDFGKGFYTTPDINFAKKTACKRYKQYKDYYYYDDVIPKVIELEIDWDKVKNQLKIKELQENNEWIKFVANNRHRDLNDLISINNHNRDNKFDIVVGPTADKMIYMLDKIFSKQKIEENFYKQFINKNYAIQYSFHTVCAIKYINNLKIVT